MPPPRLPELIGRIANLFEQETRAAAGAHGLNAAQLAVLRYLDRANRYSNTPAAVTEYFGLTKGTVSQTLIALERKALIERETDAADRRVVRLSLTRGGRLAARRQSASAAALEAADAQLRSRLEGGLETLLRTMQQANGGRSFGVCHTCRHFEQPANGRSVCGLTKEPLAADQIVRICREHAG